MSADSTIEQAPEAVRKNLDLWKEIWRERCNLFKEFGEGTYSKHILSILPDLIEEVEYNEEPFSNNVYAKSFYATNLLRYHHGSKLEESTQDVGMFSRGFTEKVQTELALVLEALQRKESSSNTYAISDLPPCLRKIDGQLVSGESCDYMVKVLTDLVCRTEEISKDNLEIIELCDTLIWLFRRKGTLPESIERLAGWVLSGIFRFGQGEISTWYPGAPDKGTSSDTEFENQLVSFFSKVTIKDRFDEIKKMYHLDPKLYEVIFRVDGFEYGTSGFSIGDVNVYDPRKEPHIKRTSLRFGKLDFAGIEKDQQDQLCVAVKIRGTDSSSMKLQARRKAERALGLISIRKPGEKPIRLSTAYAILDSDGMEMAGGTEWHKLGVLHPSNLTQLTEEEYKRFGSWINNESTNETIKDWLASMDWHRKAVECEQSSEMLLNAWFSIEHLFKGKRNLSLRVPGFLRNRPSEKHTNQLWYPKDRVAQTQLILSFVGIRRELRDYEWNVAHNFLPALSLRKSKEDFVVTDEVIDRFASNGGTGINYGQFVAASDAIVEQLQAKHAYELLDQVQLMRRLFFEREYAMEILQREIWRIKDDIYNVYRIRNMLVHRATTDSVLVEYYAARAFDYSLSILTELKWRILRTKDDSEISGIDEYFQQWVLGGNIGLEALQSGDMEGFRKWVFS